MRTSKAVSTISYNSPSFLKGKIEEWKTLGYIEYGMWIRHEPEADEKKAHYHVYLKPAKLIQTTDLEERSQEIDPQNPGKPFKMVSFRISKEDDWLLYAIHDPVYLSEKGLTRQHCYAFSDVETTCEDTLRDIISHMSDNRKGKLEYRLLECIEMGMTWGEIVRTGIIPIRQMSGALMMYRAITGQEKVL